MLRGIFLFVYRGLSPFRLRPVNSVYTDLFVVVDDTKVHELVAESFIRIDCPVEYSFTIGYGVTILVCRGHSKVFCRNRAAIVDCVTLVIYNIDVIIDNVIIEVIACIFGISGIEMQRS